jgi:N-acetyltransferase
MSLAFPLPAALEDGRVRLEALEGGHAGELAPLGEDPDFWRFGPMEPLPAGAPLPGARWLARWLAERLAAQDSGAERTYVVRRLPGREVVGTTRYLALAPEHRRLEIGGTFYVRPARGTSVNPACKRLLLGHAFEALGCVRVELKCDARNAASRAALAKLGATCEGTLRRHIVLGDGFVRDTVYFSVLDAEWPRVKADLEARLRAAGVPPEGGA